MPNLAGIHDREGQEIAPPDTWIVDTVALSENPQPTNHVGSLHWITRLNWGYGSTGTLPVPDQYAMFAQRVAAYVGASLACHRWVIGNEPNLSREWPDGQPIFPWHYAACYNLCRNTIHLIRGHEHDEVLIAAPGPWNDELKYPGNPNGDWIKYLVDVIAACDKIDGFSIHSYTHGYNVALVTSSARMQSPFQNRHYEFRTYRDYLEAIPDALNHLPIYITEANGNGPWQAVGLMPAMLGEIDAWNHTGKPKVRCVIFYRYPRYDENAQFAIEGKDDVIAEYRSACALSYQSPAIKAQTIPDKPNKQFLPNISIGGENPPAPIQRDITEDFIQRTRNAIEFVGARPGQRYFALIAADYVPNGAQVFGPDHHILVDVLDQQGNRMQGQVVTFVAGDKTVEKVIDKREGPYGVDFDMYDPGYGYGVYVGTDRTLSDRAGGMGMGTIEQPDWAHHVDFRLVFQEKVAPIDKPAPQPQPPAPPAKVPTLLHPVADKLYRTVTQVFGVNGDYYKRFSVDGVPLKGHNGIDFGTPIGAKIVAVDTGRVVEVADDPEGYGRYIKMVHPWGESLYAHLSETLWNVGNIVARGDIIGRSGNTGNSTGPHLHFGMRVSPFNRKDGWGGYIDPAPYLINAGQPQPIDAGPGPFLPGQPQPPVLGNNPPARESYLKWFRQYGTQFGVDWHLLAALAYSENKFQVQPASHAGAMGLMQFMPATWADMQTQLGVNNILDPEQSIKAAAFYLAQIRSYLIKHQKVGTAWMLAGYNWGMGRSAQGSWEQVPPETKAYIDEITEFSEALRRWEDGW